MMDDFTIPVELDDEDNTEVELTITITSYSPDRPGTYWDPPEPGELEFDATYPDGTKVTDEALLNRIYERVCLIFERRVEDRRYPDEPEYD